MIHIRKPNEAGYMNDLFEFLSLAPGIIPMQRQLDSQQLLACWIRWDFCGLSLALLPNLSPRGALEYIKKFESLVNM